MPNVFLHEQDYFTNALFVDHTPSQSKRPAVIALPPLDESSLGRQSPFKASVQLSRLRGNGHPLNTKPSPISTSRTKVSSCQCQSFSPLTSSFSSLYLTSSSPPSEDRRLQKSLQRQSPNYSISCSKSNNAAANRNLATTGSTVSRRCRWCSAFDP